jgi:multimeric flavodoxin WrbA
MKKVLVILGSARTESNTFKAIEKHLPFSEHTLMDLLKYEVLPYSYTGYSKEDDFLKIIQAMIESDVIVFATPVYWYAMSGSMKIFFDRFSDLITRQKLLGRALAGKETWLIAAGSDEVLHEGFEVPFARTSEYFDMIYQKAIYVCVKD